MFRMAFIALTPAVTKHGDTIEDSKTDLSPVKNGILEPGGR